MKVIGCCEKKQLGLRLQADSKVLHEAA